MSQFSHATAFDCRTVDALIAHGLAQPTDFFATAELGSEVVYGKGRTTLRVFRLR